MKRHVLVVRLDSDGDVLVTGPAIRAVAAGADRVTLLCGPRGRQAASLLPGVDRLVVHRAAWIDPEPDRLDRATALALVSELAALEADEAVIFTSFHQSALPTALLLRMAAVQRIGAISEDYPGSLLDVRHRVDDDVHEVERALSLAAACGFELPDRDDGRLRIRRPPHPLRLQPGYVVVHPGASVPARAWPAVRLAERGAVLVDSGRQVVVTGGPDERGLTARVAGGDRKVLDLGGQTSLGQLADVLADAAAVVVANTGPAHLAAAVGTPVVSLFAPVVPAVRWRPWRVPHVLLGDQSAPCADTRARTCPVPGHPCLASVSALDVMAALEQVAQRELVAL